MCALGGPVVSLLQMTYLLSLVQNNNLPAFSSVDMGLQSGTIEGM